jgi:hypothetical protein
MMWQVSGVFQVDDYFARVGRIEPIIPTIGRVRMSEKYRNFSIETVGECIYVAIPDGGSNAGIVDLTRRKDLSF